MLGFLFLTMFNLVANVLTIGSIAFVAYSLFTISKKWTTSDKQDLFNLLVVSGAFLVLVRIFDFIVKSISEYEFKPLLSLFLVLIAIGVPVAIYFITTSSGEVIYEDGYFEKIKNKEFLKSEIMASFGLFIDQLEKISNKVSKDIGENKSASDQEAYKYTEEAGDFKGMLNEKRSLLLFIVLNIITLGIYKFYFVYSAAKDTNIACNGDGDNTSGLLKYIILSVLTCGLYAIYWDYALANRLAANGSRYGYNIQENGTNFLLWWLLGGWVCGLGLFVARNITIKNLNKICRGYNQSNPRF